MPKSKAATPKTNGASAWALVAVSSEGQADTLQHQRRWAEEVAVSQGWRLTRVVEGVSSGRAGPRRLVRELLADLRALTPEARPQWLLMVRADRLGRGSIVESQIVLRDLLALGVAVFTRDQGEVKLDTAMAELISAATLAVAAHENEVRADRQLAVYRRKRAAGERVGNRLPYGLVRTENGGVTADPERASIVEAAFKLRLEGKGYVAIGRRVAPIAPPHVYANGSEYPVNWVPSRVKDLLQNRSYVGMIIDEGTFARAQRVADLITAPDRNLDQRRRHPWPLASSMRCFCGHMLIGTISGNARRRHRYYGCRVLANHDGHSRLLPAKAIEDQFVALLAKLRASPQLVERYRRRASSPMSPRILERSLQELKRKLADIARRRDAAWELHVSGKVRSDDVQERLDDLAQQRDEIQGQLATLQEQIAIAKEAEKGQQDAEALISRAVTIFKRANVAEQNQIARAVSVELGAWWSMRTTS